METKLVVVCVIAGIVGLLAAALGFAAEATKVKGSQISPDISNNVCSYPSNPASALGFVSAVTLVVALVISNAASGCFCCYTKISQYPRSFKLSWSTFAVGFVMMVGAATLSHPAIMSTLRSQDRTYGTYYYCYYVKPGVFAAAACLSLVSVLSGLVCFISLDSASRKSVPSDGDDIAMGQPQVSKIRGARYRRELGDVSG